ncbi:zinc ABC transporter substrate-binding protein [Nereida sp. MMG025]|uniref:zinc ABC transporter substrate-binding protein n=1 Tax=Nereida sp. MMG025 TaxID=2909981 RepID=UPI001F3472D9|nr:zinc ABC transporter substrate-binding protein [Nereida sp. MMG025]MCF6443730.1 zinc ABC transporter substrate-binding protein [Nereida sp. MMG025]
MLRNTALSVALICAGPALAEAPNVMTDIPPVHSIVSAIMEGVGTPDIIVDRQTSVHNMQLKPSQMRGLQETDLLIWVGPTLSPWMEKPVASAVGEGKSMVLADVEGVIRLEGHDHDHDHGEEDHAEDEHADHEGHDDHADHEGHDDHKDDAASYDPHLWLSPDNAIVWVQAITGKLIEIDPENAETYAANALEFASGLALMSLAHATELNDYPHFTYIVGHDALGYLEAFYDRRSIAQIVPTDGSAASVARVQMLQGLIAERKISCVLQDYETPDKIVAQLVAGEDIPVRRIDPLGQSLEFGPDLYMAVMTDLHQAMLDCAQATPAAAHDDDHKEEDHDHDDHDDHDH